MKGRRIPIPLPNSGLRKRNSFYLRGIIVFCILLFFLLQFHTFSYTDSRADSILTEPTNDSVDAILSMVPFVLHKFLMPKTRNISSENSLHNSTASGLISSHYSEVYHPPNITEIKRHIARYNDMQVVLNEETFGPLQNDSVIIVIQVHTRITYLRHLIVSLAQARDISKTLLIFSHDYYDEDINDLVQTIDFCKVIQIFYPYSIQTHPHEYPGVDPNDCPRDIKKDQAIIRNCNNALHPDLYGHYREAKFTQTKHHWWWKANRVFDQLDVTRHHTGLVLFLEEDHYVAEDFLYLLDMMERRTADLCAKCNVLSLGTYLKTFNYYTYSKTNKKSISSQYASLLISSNNLLGSNINRNSQKSSSQTSSSSSYPSAVYNSKSHYEQNSLHKSKTSYIGDTSTNKKDNKYTNANSINNNNNNNNAQWSYHVLPSLYSVYQKIVYRMASPTKEPSLWRFREVEVMPWISSKHNMGFAFNRTTWSNIRSCSQHFCSYDDYNWDWSLQHLSQQCLKKKLHAMIVKGPRVFHIGECGVHHKKKNCESNQVISKVQHVLKIARRSGQLFPRSITLTIASVMKKTKLRKGNGGWGDLRDHELCMNMTLPTMSR